MKDILVEFSRVISDETTARNFIACMGNGLPDSEAAGDAFADWLDLQEKRPGQAQIFSRAVTSGVAAALSRWPSAERLCPDTLADLIVDPEREVASVVRSARPVRHESYDNHAAPRGGLVHA